MNGSDRPERMPIKLYLDGASEPFKIAIPPLRFRFKTLSLPDGPHELMVEASNGLAPPTRKSIPFFVRNGVAVSVTGLEADQCIGGQVNVLVNAYAGAKDVEFEPKRAETPQPVPSWMWMLVLAIGAWALTYVLLPRSVEQHHAAAPAALSGESLYMDTCARCHGEGGAGLPAGRFEGVMLVPALRGATHVSVAPTPVQLLSKVVVGVEDTQMPAWGPLFENDALLAVVNHVRRAWGHDASTISLNQRAAPPPVLALDAARRGDLLQRNANALAYVGLPRSATPVLFRRGDRAGGTVGASDLAARWSAYWQALDAGVRVHVELSDMRYSYDARALSREGAFVVGSGRMDQWAERDSETLARARGRTLRVYQRRANRWFLALDFADLPFRVGAEPEAAPPPSETKRKRVAKPPPGKPLGFEEVMALFEGMGRSAKTAPHGNFWRVSYDEFVAQHFEYELPDGIAQVRMVVPYDSEKSNLIRALRDGKGMICLLKGSLREVDIRRMPVGTAPLDEDQVAAISHWIDQGCPERAGEASQLPRVPADDLLRQGPK